MFLLTKKDNMTIFMTTHDPEILEILENVYVLEDGQLANDKQAYVASSVRLHYCQVL